jgi:cyanophycinase
MADPDRRAIELAGGLDARISVIPAAAAPDDNHRRAGGNAQRWFESLGAKHVTVLPLIDRASANEAAVVDTLRESRLIYLLGGFTHYLGQTLAGSAGWQAILDAYQMGAVVGGSSAGAMVLCEYYYDLDGGRVVEGLNLVPNACVLPHYNTFGKGWVSKLTALLPGQVLIGIDERTGMLDDGENGAWHVYGQGAVTLHRGGRVRVYTAQQSFTLVQ